MPNEPIFSVLNRRDLVADNGLTSTYLGRHADLERLFTAPAEPLAPTRPTEPDPSRIYGYVALVDPATGQKHLAHGADDPSMTNGYPHYLTLTFRSADLSRDIALYVSGSGNTLEVVRRTDGNLDYWGPNNHGFAWYYDIQLNADRTESEPRIGGPAGVLERGRTELVSYNPDQWWFAGIAADFVDISDANGSYTDGRRRWNRVPLTRCDAPFADLPNTD